MADGICDLDNRRPATYVIRARQNGEETTLELYDAHYQQLCRQQSQASPFESLFAGGDYGDFFGYDLDQLASRLGAPLPHERKGSAGAYA